MVILPKYDPYYTILSAMKEDVKKYLGYPPHNVSSNIYKRDENFLTSIERKYGRKLPDLLRKTELEDYGETQEPKIYTVPRKSIITATKRIYGIDNLYFFKQYGNWQCTFDSAFKEREDNITDADAMAFRAMIKFLAGEINYRGKKCMFSVLLLDNKSIYTSLDDLREEILIRKLSGV